MGFLLVRPAEEVGTPLAGNGRAADAGDGVCRGSMAAPVSARARFSTLSATARTRCRRVTRCVLRCASRSTATPGGTGTGRSRFRACALLLMTISDRWSGIRTRDTWKQNPLLYPSELSRGQRAGLARCRSRLEPASACATAMPRAPDGTQARTAVTDRNSTAHCRLFRNGNPFALPRYRGARVCWTSFANAETKMPPAWSPRAFAVPRKIGVTDLPWRSRSGLVRAFVRETRAQARIALWQRWQQAVGYAVLRGHDRSTTRMRERVAWLRNGSAPYSRQCTRASEMMT